MTKITMNASTSGLDRKQYDAMLLKDMLDLTASTAYAPPPVRFQRMKIVQSIQSKGWVIFASSHRGWYVLCDRDRVLEWYPESECNQRGGDRVAKEYPSLEYASHLAWHIFSL